MYVCVYVCVRQAFLVISMFAMSYDAMRTNGKLAVYFVLLALTVVLVCIQSYTYKIYLGFVKRREAKSVQESISSESSV